MFEKIKELILEDGTRILQPHFVCYHDEQGVCLDGGTMISPSGESMGHLDPPGKQGIPGWEGMKQRYFDEVTIHPELI